MLRPKRTTGEGKPSPPADTPEAKAKQLLYRFLTAEQRDSLEQNGYFDVPGRDYVYRLGVPMVATKVFQQGSSKSFNLCVQTVENVLNPDWHLTLLLMIQADEDKFLKTGRRLDNMAAQHGTRHC